MSKHLIHQMTSLFIGLTLTGCGSYFYCYVDAIGTEPTDKTYYIENHLPEDVNPLVVAEFNSNLEKVMAHKGYSRTDSANADLKIVFGYNLGEAVERQEIYSAPIYQYNPGGTTTSKTNTTLQNSYGQTVAKAQSTTTQKTNPSINIVGTQTGTSYTTHQDVTIILDAYSNITKEPIWSVTITDNAPTSVTSDMRQIMVYYLLNAEPYIGTNTGKKRYSEIKMSDKRLQEFKNIK